MAGLQARDAGRTEPPEQTADDAAFEALFRAQYPAVVRLAHGVVGDGQAAQDVAQEVFLAAYRRFPGGAEQAVGWVRIAAVHTALNHLRGERRRGRRESGAPGDSLPSAEDVVVGREERAEVRRALGRLPARAATVAVLRHSGLSYIEIADVLGVRVGQVGTLLKRAESALRKEMERATRR